MDESNTWLHEGGAQQAEQYVRSADVIVPDRERIMRLVLDLFGYHFGERTGLSVLDLGCGDGIITERLCEMHPQNTFYLLDGSTVMLAKARQRLTGSQFHFVQQTFGAYLDAQADDQRYDLIFSVNAIHHLGFPEKVSLFARLYREMRYGGLLLISDPVLPTSERSERWQFRMWRDAVAEALARQGRHDEVGQYDDLPLEYKYKAENKPSTLFAQMQSLRQVGFRDVDCLYKNGIFALIGGTK